MARPVSETRLGRRWVVGTIRRARGDLRSGDGRGQIPAPNSRVRRAGSETRDQLPSTSNLVPVGDDLGTNEGGTVRSSGPYGATAITIQGRRNVATSWRVWNGTVRSSGPYSATATTIQGRRNVATSWRVWNGTVRNSGPYGATTITIQRRRNVATCCHKVATSCHGGRISRRHKPHSHFGLRQATRRRLGEWQQISRWNRRGASLLVRGGRPWYS
jgi:hypothetical protein